MATEEEEHEERKKRIIENTLGESKSGWGSDAHVENILGKEDNNRERERHIVENTLGKEERGHQTNGALDKNESGFLTEKHAEDILGKGIKEVHSTTLGEPVAKERREQARISEEHLGTESGTGMTNGALGKPKRSSKKEKFAYA